MRRAGSYFSVGGSDFQEGKGHGICFRAHISFTTSQADEQLLASQLKMMCCIDSMELQLLHIPRSSRFLIFSQYGPHLWALCMSFHINVLTLVDKSRLFFMAAVHILSLEGRVPSRS